MICAPYKELIIPDSLKSPNWDTALAWLKGDHFKNIPFGEKVEIDGNKVYVRRSSGLTKMRNECRYESHRLYADIQMLIKGSELFLVCPRDGMKISEHYSEEKDVDFLEGEPVLVHSIILTPPLAVAVFPWDLHMPGIALYDKPSDFDKIVMKIAL